CVQGFVLPPVETLCSQSFPVLTSTEGKKASVCPALCHRVKDSMRPFVFSDDNREKVKSSRGDRFGIKWEDPQIVECPVTDQGAEPREVLITTATTEHATQRQIAASVERKPPELSTLNDGYQIRI
ncbi:hypothetical protein KUCAC02_029632, partial [Chaenocephalus aceratus]